MREEQTGLTGWTGLMEEVEVEGGGLRVSAGEAISPEKLQKCEIKEFKKLQKLSLRWS